MIQTPCILHEGGGGYGFTEIFFLKVENWKKVEERRNYKEYSITFFNPVKKQQKQ